MTSRRPPPELSEPYDCLELVKRWAVLHRLVRQLDADAEARAELTAITEDLSAVLLAVPRAGPLIPAAHRRLDALEGALLLRQLE